MNSIQSLLGRRVVGVRGAVAIAALTCVVTVVGVRGWDALGGAESAPPPVVSASPDPTLQVERKLGQAERDLRMLQSGECPDDQFRRVVNGFAAIRYEPAIPYLVGNIDFVPAGTSDAFFGLDSVQEMFPCVGALLAYGDSAVGPLIDAYLQEPNKVRRGLLALPISGDKMERLAFFYARGILTSKQTRIKVHPEAADDLMQWLSQRNWQHFEFTPDI